MTATAVLREQQVEKQTREPFRTEDPRLLTGRARFIDDLNETNQAFMGLVLSPFAHAKISRIDFSKISSSNEFIDSLTGEDLIKQGVLPVAQNPWPPQKSAKRYHLAVGKVRFVGEPVAAILVKNKNSLEDLMEQVVVEYETLPAVTTIEESKQCKSLVYDEWKDNNVSQTGQERKGDAEKAIMSAAYVINLREGIKRQESAPIEPHAVLVKYDEAKDIFEVQSTVQSVHGWQRLLSTELKMPKEKFHVRVMDVGGGFGSKGGPSYPWPLLACLFAKKTRLPVKFTASRTEEFLEAAAGRDEYCDITLACDKDAKIVALKANIECDVGVSGTQTHMPSLTMWTMEGAYKIDNLDLNMTAYVTNKMPIGPVRGAGAPEGCYFIEHAIETMAKKLGIDPIEFRRRNVVEPKKAEGKEDYQSLLDTLVKSAGYEHLINWRDDVNSMFREHSHNVAVRSSLVAGIGLSLRGGSESEDEEEDFERAGAEGEGFFGGGSEQSQWKKSEDSRNDQQGENDQNSWGKDEEQPIDSSSEWQSNEEADNNDDELSFISEYARVALYKSGKVIVYTGSSPHGQGHETVFAQLASEELGIPFEQVQVVWGDTDLVPMGIGTFGSRSLSTGGSSLVDASRKLKNELRERASKILNVRSDSLDVRNGAVISKVSRNAKSLSFQEILEQTGADEISAESKYALSDMSYSSGVHLCAVTLDVETGKVKIAKYFVVEDCGRMINRAIVEGQIEGGVVHGVGGALLESLEYDDQGNLLTTTFMDYSIPTSFDSPNIEIFHKITPSTITLNGAKGVGESGTIGSYAAVINAVNDAISKSVGGASSLDIAPGHLEDVYELLKSK